MPKYPFCLVVTVELYLSKITSISFTAKYDVDCGDWYITGFFKFENLSVMGFVKVIRGSFLVRVSKDDVKYDLRLLISVSVPGWYTLYPTS